MGIKKQIGKIKENWLLIVLAIVLFLFMSGGNGFFSNVVTSNGLDDMLSFGEVEKMGVSDSMNRGYYSEIVNSDFAPESEERKIIKTASLSTEIKRGLLRKLN